MKPLCITICILCGKSNERRIQFIENKFRQIGARVFATRFMVAVLLTARKVGKSIVNLLWIWFGSYRLWEFFKRSPY